MPNPRPRPRRARDSALAGARDLASARDLAQDLASALALARASLLASTLARELFARHVNASGADLSGLEIERVKILEGVTWTDQTRWPSGIKELVREASEEIGDGVYQVRTGDASDLLYMPLM